MFFSKEIEFYCFRTSQNSHLQEKLIILWEKIFFNTSPKVIRKIKPDFIEILFSLTGSNQNVLVWKMLSELCLKERIRAHVIQKPVYLEIILMSLKSNDRQKDVNLIKFDF